MADQMISAFTPSLMSHAELETIFVQQNRQALAQEVFEKIILSATTQAKHYALLVGMRGMGKTHMVALIYYRLLAEFEKAPELKEKLVIAWLREEEWGVDSWLDLVSRILRALAIEEPQAKSLLAELKRISVEGSIEQAAINAKQFLKRAIGQRTLLLIMENLDDLFKGLGVKGQQYLRSFLQQDSCCTILATTPALFDGVQSRAQPFFGFFHTRDLARLEVSEAIEMLTKIATLGGQEDLASFLQTPLGRARVRAVHHLAGGNPRLYMLFSQFITRDALDSLVKAFMKMLDDLTPYYQARMKELSNQQRKVVELLVDRRHPVMVKEIAAECFIDAGTAASQLRDLRGMGYVEAEQNGRESFYELREVLMRLCLEVKKQRGQWVEIFLEFLRIWYPPWERKGQLELTQLVKAEQYIKAQSLLPQLIGQSDEQTEKSGLSTIFQFLEGCELLKSEKHSEALAVFDSLLAEDGNHADAWNGRGISLLRLGRYEEAIASYDKALLINPENYYVSYNKGFTYFKWGKYTESIDCFDKSIALQSDNYNSWHSKGIVQFVMGNHPDALTAWQQAFQIVQQLPTHPNDINELIKEFLEELIPRFTLFPNNSLIAQVLTIYQEAKILPELSTALIKTLPQILDPNISDRTADRWLELWQSLLGHETALEMPLRLMSTAIAYKKQPAQQKRLWLGLAKEERSILDQSLA
jgi:tetratricopeptide (TPR) repeat protein